MPSWSSIDEGVDHNHQVAEQDEDEFAESTDAGDHTDAVAPSGGDAQDAAVSGSLACVMAAAAVAESAEFGLDYWDDVYLAMVGCDRVVDDATLAVECWTPWATVAAVGA